MSDSKGDLAGFAYGEDLEGVSLRSLGYRLLSPCHGEPWCAEVETLARRLQAAPYSDLWPPTDLFCSVLLSEGKRLVALARYGLADHTPSQRRGGLELVGVISSVEMNVSASLSLYHWLGQRRESLDDLHQFGGHFALDDILATIAPSTPDTDPVPVLPVRLWQEGALLFAASTPTDPDHRLRLLEQANGTSWQWLPLVGADFPLHTYAQRGPLIAWTPHLAGVALKLDHKSSDTATPQPPRHGTGRSLLVGLLFLVLVLLTANLGSTLLVYRSFSSISVTAPRTGEVQSALSSSDKSAVSEDGGRKRFLEALQELLMEGGAGREWELDKPQLLDRYERLVQAHPELRISNGTEADKITVAAFSILAKRGGDQIENEVRKALSNKGFSDHVIQAACAHVRDQFRPQAGRQH